MTKFYYLHTPWYSQTWINFKIYFIPIHIYYSHCILTQTPERVQRGRKMPINGRLHIQKSKKAAKLLTDTKTVRKIKICRTQLGLHWNLCRICRSIAGQIRSELIGLNSCLYRETFLGDVNWYEYSSQNVEYIKIFCLKSFRGEGETLRKSNYCCIQNHHGWRSALGQNEQVDWEGKKARTASTIWKFWVVRWKGQNIEVGAVYIPQEI